ncbi:class C sortase [Arthrobacter sp. HLT1-20]
MGSNNALARAGAGSGLRRRLPVSVLLIAALIFVGVSVLLYPSTASWFSQLQQSRDVNQYASSVQRLGPEGRSAAIVAAQDYNGTLTGGALLDPFSQAPAGDLSAASELYRKQLSLSPDGVMARLQIPSINADLPIFHGTSDSVLQRGVGHLLGTALPVGGPGTHAVFTGHTGLPEATLFTHLEEVQLGDSVELEVYGEVLTYRVTTIEVVLPTKTESLRPVQGKDLISLITCTPTGVNTHRLIVTGERITNPELQDQPVSASAALGPPWWAAGMGMAGLASISILLVAAHRGRPREES